MMQCLTVRFFCCSAPVVVSMLWLSSNTLASEARLSTSAWISQPAYRRFGGGITRAPSMSPRQPSNTIRKVKGFSFLNRNYVRSTSKQNFRGGGFLAVSANDHGGESGRKSGEPRCGNDGGDEEIPALREIRKSSAGPTVWSEFGALAAKTGAINLGQGFPNWEPPEFVVAAAQKALMEGFHQYTRTAGHPRLVKLLAEQYSVRLGREIDPMDQVAITVGASEALYLTFQAILSPGDEVVLLEPFFDLYVGQIRLAGGVPRNVPLEVEHNQFRVNADRIRSVMSPKTRAIVVNTPHNPTGRVFSREELEAIAEIVRENPRVLVVSDEVYEYMVYADGKAGINGYHGPNPTVARVFEDSGKASGVAHGAEKPPSDVVAEGSTGTALDHIHFSTLEGMRDRTITVSSAGKTFSVTGWQVGWVLGPKRVVKEIQTLLPYMQFCVATPMQEAFCSTLVEAERPYRGHKNYYAWLRHHNAGKRARLEGALAAAGIRTLKGEGGFFLIADVSGIEIPDKYLNEVTPAMPVMTRDWAFCRWMAIEHGLVAIPTSPFFSEASRSKGMGDGFVRLCFCKTDDLLDAAAKALLNMARGQEGSSKGGGGARMKGSVFSGSGAARSSPAMVPATAVAAAAAAAAAAATISSKAA